MILSLPTEILQYIVDGTVRLQDRKNLRRTCSHLGVALRPSVLSTVTLNIYSGNLEPGISLLEALTTEKNALYSQHIRTLTIESLSPSFIPDPKYIEKQHECRYSYELETLDREWVMVPVESKVNASLESLLEPALKSLRNLKAIRVTWHKKDLPWTLNTVMGSLSTLPLIREFTLSCFPNGYKKYNDYGPRSPTLIPLDSLPEMPNLQVLSISGNFSLVSATPLIKHLLASTTSLSTLRIDRDVGVELAYERPSMSEFGIPSTVSHLGLGGISVSTRELSCLNLSFLELHRDVPVEDDFWKYLIARQVRLRGLVVPINQPTDVVLDYLESYSGLESLSIRGPRWYTSPAYNKSGDRFYSGILQLHRKSLVTLAIEPTFESSWCFGEHNVDSLRRCTRLRNLSVRIEGNGLVRDPEAHRTMIYGDHHPRSTPPHANPVHVLLGMINSSMPDLQTLRIDSARNWRWAHDHADLMFGAQNWLSVRRRLRASVESLCHTCDGEGVASTEMIGARSVLRWVKVYVGDERVDKDLSVENRDEPEDVIGEKKSKRLRPVNKLLSKFRGK